ncbi:hypothetical protein FTX61_06790 [Nitriliruptoraceae bacterium ZYF776]|nr:hypothetical protein [Profundirhabdus halotolerans]
MSSKRQVARPVSLGSTHEVLSSCGRSWADGRGQDLRRGSLSEVAGARVDADQHDPPGRSLGAAARRVGVIDHPHGVRRNLRRGAVRPHQTEDRTT